MAPVKKMASEADTQLEKSVQGTTRHQWAANLIARKVPFFELNFQPIRHIAKEFTQNKKIKPSDYTTEAYEKNDAKNRYYWNVSHWWGIDNSVSISVSNEKLDNYVPAFKAFNPSREISGTMSFRYNDIICIDATRVVLKDRPPADDYIHASWMTMPDGQKYICTQGPLLEYVVDFWHMITSEKSNVIVMVCNFNEGKHEKCCFYLPKGKKESGSFGDFKVQVKEIKPDPFEGIKHTVLFVKWEEKSMTVHHLAYFSWPDHTAPLNPAPTIGMLKLSRSLSAGATITVHCSAGIGRSATFIAIDYASQKIREKWDFNMVDVIRELRKQRFQAIQSAIQYVFLHVCLLEMFAEVSEHIGDSDCTCGKEKGASGVKVKGKSVGVNQSPKDAPRIRVPFRIVEA
ncbi:unnamed protein product [Nippostrongylus brasiliensis]|uniref:Protein-tyrosine phosphatase n=1 Tax=Nippostrongylus brasiliensis TaxID=27835 RepID=A0A0N4Y753_NIPBR|nr:unnamed protein product [Nippostrongylus brasiliensis]